jgi:hypothetical protein
MNFHNPSTRQTKGLPLKPVLLVICLAAAGLLAHGVIEQNAAPIESRHDGGRVNPWRGLPGCIQMTALGGQTVGLPSTSGSPNLGCPQAFGSDDSAITADTFWGHAAPVLVELRGLAKGPSTTQVPGRHGEAVPQVLQTTGPTLAQGANVHLSLRPENQVEAQALADCMTGDVDRCRRFNINPERWVGRYEDAGARMVGLVDIDIASGRILAIASAHTPCFAAHWGYSGAAANGGECPVLPTISAPQIWRLDNHALFTTAMMASTNKPALMLALLRSPAGPGLHQGKGREWVLNTLKTSNSDALFDKLFCADTSFFANCQRLAGLPKAASDLGITGGTLGLVPRHVGALQVQNSRLLMHQKAGAWVFMPASGTMSATDIASIQQCSAQSFEQCSGEKTANLVSELWGQGNAQATVLSAAQMMARLGAAANGQNAVDAHLIATLGRDIAAPAAAPQAIERHHASLITAGLTTTSQPGGTAHAACLAVWNAKTCKNMAFLAAKTGTPSFNHEHLTLAERAIQCNALKERVSNAKASATQVAQPAQAEVARCHMQPHKWLVTLVKDSDAPGAPYTRAVAVLAERNYSRATGRVDSAGDRGINVAAEMAFRYVAQTRALAADAARP